MLVERIITGREYLVLLKQADPACASVQKTLTCFAWGAAVPPATSLLTLPSCRVCCPTVRLPLSSA